MNPIGEPDAGDRHVRFDERGWETGDWQSLKHRAHPRLYPLPALADDGRVGPKCRPTPAVDRRAASMAGTAKDATAALRSPQRPERNRAPVYLCCGVRMTGLDVAIIYYGGKQHLSERKIAIEIARLPDICRAAT